MKTTLPAKAVGVLVIAATLIAVWSFAWRAAAGTTASIPEPSLRDVTYCAPGGVPLKMDIYATQKPNGSLRPAVMFVHGGSWSSGDKAGSEGAPETAELVSRGYLVASINYRLAPEYVFPAQIEDVKCAVRYLRANAANLGIDPSRIGAWGASAGGQLVSLLGTTDESAGLEGDGGYENQSSRVQAVVDMYGRADLSEVPLTRPDLLPIFAGEANLAKYSPVTYVSKDDPPFLILHGDRDTTVPPELSVEFYGKLRAAGVPATLVMVKNAGHGFAPWGSAIDPTRQQITRMVGDFFDRYLRNLATVSSATRVPIQARTLPPGGEVFTFARTGKVVRGIFLDYWRSHGGIEQEGYPISSELQEISPADGKVYTVQYFERAVFEYHPENKPPYNVLASLLGTELYRAKYPQGAPSQQANDAPDSVLFGQTGRRVGGDFLRYWREHGGVMEQGYPISDEFIETSGLDGKSYRVQYFERAVFEYHPENDRANQVMLSQLGTFKYREIYRQAWPNEPDQVTPLK